MSITDFIGGGYKEMLGKTFRFKTIDEAEDYYWANLAVNNEDEKGRDYWLEQIADDIEESWLSNK